VAINDVLPVKAARRYTIANWICWVLGNKQLNFDGSMHLHSRCGITYATGTV